MLFRRSPTLVGWWEGSSFRICNYATRKDVAVHRADLSLLSALDDWQSADDLRVSLAVPRRSLTAALSRLLTQTAIESSDRAAPRAQSALVGWSDWSPAAPFYHFATKDGTYASRRQTRESLALWESTDEPPPPRKTCPGPRITLPQFARHGEFAQVLLARRTWRRFGRGGISINQLSTLVGLTWATQQWVHVGNATLALKTSPSGGAAHSLEVYVAARHVRGLERGIYHYDSDSHALVQLKKGWRKGWIGRWLAGQSWYRTADALVFMTSVFPRVQWKYRFPRAYRIVLLEAGHFCQTFCLTATWLGLAPFCTAALADTLIERTLGLDGVSESVLYAMGVGVRPPHTTWAPFPNRPGAPRTSAPAHRIERHARAVDKTRR